MSLALESPHSLGVPLAVISLIGNMPVGVMLLPAVSPPHFSLTCWASLAYPRIPRCCIPTVWLGQRGGCYLQLPQDRMVLDAGEQDAHGISTIVQVGDS